MLKTSDLNWKANTVSLLEFDLRYFHTFPRRTKGSALFDEFSSRIVSEKFCKFHVIRIVLRVLNVEEKNGYGYMFKVTFILSL
jgi:hypothetical protein